MNFFFFKTGRKKWKDSESEKNGCESESGQDREEAVCVTCVIGRMVKELGLSVVARCGPLYYFLKERSNIFGHLGHLGHFEKCQACLHMTMEVTSNLEVILKVIFV